MDPPKPHSSAASHSSVVNDLGNARYLADTRTSGHTKSNRDSQASVDELVAFSGAGLVDNWARPATCEVDLSSQGDATPQDIVDKARRDYTSGKALGESIRAASLESRTRDNRKFLPNDALDNIVTKERVKEELSNLKLGLPAQLEHFADNIWQVTKVQGKGTTRRRIFAILALMEQCEDIVDFIRDGIYDSDLPFILLDEGHQGRPQLHRRRKSGKLEPIQFLSSKWKINVHESFDRNQWQLLAPYFELLTESSPRVLHYPLASDIVLPFIEDDEVKRDAGHSEGGFGDVWRVKIHPAHHNCCEDTAQKHENPSYAVKRLRLSSREAFDLEVSNLKRFSANDHVHLIKLLVTFSWREQFYLLFPWANGNLMAFWKDLHPHPSNPIRDHRLAMWFSKQCLGIAQGLQMIHTADMPIPDDLPQDSARQSHGRHGDLKPENILWFKSYEGTDQDSFGVLKISDFGLTRFHGTLSKSRFERVALSPTYRPPEFDVAMMVSQAFDIWSLGCVLLEFVTWYLLGGDGVEKFSQERARDDSTEFREDTFFSFVTIKEKDGGTRLGARAKLSVANKFQELYSQNNCSDFMVDLLTFIKDRLLRVSPENRTKCEEIVGKFEQFYKDCTSDPDYYTKRKKKIPERTGTALSELTESALHISQEREDKIQRHILPGHTGLLESDLSSSQPPESPSLSGDYSDVLNGHDPIMRSISPEGLQSSFKGSPIMRSVSPERRQSSLKGKSPERMDTVLEERTALTSAFRGPRPNYETDSTPSRPSSLVYAGKPSSQSPNKRVQFEQNQQRISGTGVSKPGHEFGASYDHFSDQQDQNEKRIHMMQDPVTLSHLGGSFMAGLALGGFPDMPLPTPGRKKYEERATEAEIGSGLSSGSARPDSTVDTDYSSRDDALTDDNMKPPNPATDKTHEIGTEDAENASTSTDTNGGEGEPLNGALTGASESSQPEKSNEPVNGIANGGESHVQDSHVPVNQGANRNSSHAQDKTPGSKAKPKKTSKRARVKHFLFRLFRSQKRKLRQLKNLEKG